MKAVGGCLTSVPDRRVCIGGDTLRYCLGTKLNSRDNRRTISAVEPKVGVLIVNRHAGRDRLLVDAALPEGVSFHRRVIEAPRLLWWFVLNVIILSKRPQAKGRDYDKIWNREKDESPLKTITRSQSERSWRRLSRQRDKLVFDWAMRYGNPSIASRLDYLRAQGCNRILWCRFIRGIPRRRRPRPSPTTRLSTR